MLVLAEEMMEAGQRAIKALRFGLDQVQPGQELSNTSRVRGEVLDVLAVCSMLRDEGIELFNFASNSDMRHMRDKVEQVERFMQISYDQGVLAKPENHVDSWVDPHLVPKHTHDL